MRTGRPSSLRRQGASLLAVILCAVLALPAQALTPNNPFPSAVRVIDETVCTGVFEVVAQPRTGLFCRDNPVNLRDPSGYDGTVIELNVSGALVTGLAAFTAASVYEAKTHAIGTLLVASYEGFRNAIANAADEYKFYNKKQTEAVVTGLIATASAHVAKIEGFGDGGSDPNDPRNHWRKEIKAALDRAKRLIEKRLTGDKQQELLKKVKELADKSDVTLE